MKVTQMRFMSVTILLIMILMPQLSLAQQTKNQDNIQTRPNVRFNNKKLMKMKNPGLQITDKIDNPFLRAEYERLRLMDPKTGIVPSGIRELEMEYMRSSKSGLSRSRVDITPLMEPGDQSAPWINRGPFNVGGRTRAIAIDRTNENIIFAGGVSGGLWRSTDVGANWTKITPGTEHPSITDIIQDPRPGFENVWYYTTGERIGNSAGDNGAFYAGNGVYKSTDGGLTFNVLPATQNNTPQSFSSTEPFDLIFGIDMDPTNGNIYVATFIGVYRSTDGGTTFEEVLNAPFDNESDIHITSSGVLYATVASDATESGVFRSTDGAPGTWSNITPAGFPVTFNRTVISTAPSNENVLYLLSVTPGAGTLGMSFWKYTYISGDGTGSGGSWEDRSANIPAFGGSVGNFNPQGGYNLIVRAHPLNENLVFIGGTNLYRSFDGFSTPITIDNWIAGYAVTNDVSLYTNQHPDHHGLEFFSSNPDRALSSHDGGLSLTSNIQAFDAGGPLGNEPVTWSSLNNGYLTTQTYALAIGPGDQLQAGFQDNSTWFVNNTGSNSPWTFVAGADGSYNTINDDGTLRYVSFQNGTTFRQEYSDADSDIPLTQDFITPNGASGFLFVNPFERDPNNDEIMYMAAGTTVWRNDDLPNATPNVGWTALTNSTVTSTVSAIGVSTNPPNVAYFGSTGGQLIRVNNANIGNPTGIEVTGTNFPAGANVTSIDVNPYNADDVIVAFSNYSVNSIFQTTDGGNTWIDISGNLEENPDGSGSGPSVRWVTRIGFNDRFFAATSVGLYSTKQLNGPATIWAQEDPNGIGNVVIEQIRKRDSDGLVVLGTHANGLYSANFEVTPPPIIVVNPLADVEVDVNSAPSTIDLSNTFQSTVDPPEALTFSVSGNNPGLLTPSLSGTDLTLTFLADQFGEAVITVTATDESSNQANEVFIVTVNPPPLIITEFPYLENFENGENGAGSFPRDWEVEATPPYTWIVNSGPTPTGGFNNATGPLVDNSTGTSAGFYVYTESSGGADGDTTELISPPVVISSLENPAFEFWYHLFGDDIVYFETLVVDDIAGDTTQVFLREGPVQTAQNDPYQLQIVPLSSFGDTIRVIFRGVRGAVVTDGFLGDMAIDDVRFFEAPVELVTATPTELAESLEKGQTSVQVLTLTNISDSDVTYDITLENPDVGVGTNASVVTLSSGRASKLVTRTDQFNGNPIDPFANSAITDNLVGLLTTEQYSSGFENFLIGDINGQDGWVGQFGNWAIEIANPSEGTQHLRSLADGLGQTLAFSPQVPVGSEEVSSFSAKVNIEGAGVTWEIIPQSNSASLVNTRLRFNPDGSVDALTSDGVGGGAFQPLGISAPSGYFKVDIEINRVTSEFTISFDDQPVFSGLGFTGDIEQIVLLSQMEVAGPTFDLDELQIIDGAIDRTIPFVAIDPASGVIGSGTSVDIQVTFDATEQDFGTFTTNIVAAINGGADEPVVVPATLSVVGEPSIFVDPTVVQAVVDFNKPETRIVTIENTGGNPLVYDLSVIGADVGVTTTELSNQINAYSSDRVLLDGRVQAKLEMDFAQSLKIEDIDPDPLFITIGEQIFTEDFDGGVFPPTGWTVVDNEGSGLQWQFASEAGETNYSGTGEAATVSSDAFGAAEFDTELRTPIIDVAGKANLSLTYNVNYQNFASLDFLDLDISTDEGNTWTTLLSWNEDHGAFRSLPGEQVSIPLDAAIGGANNIMLRWRYYDPNTGDFDWYAQIDDVVINENTEVWMALNQTSGTVPVGETAEIELQFDPTVTDPGFYVAGIIVNSNASNTPVVGVVVSMEELEPAEIVISPESLEQELVAGRKASQTITIANEGESTLEFSFEDNFSNVGTVIPSQVANTFFGASQKSKRDGEIDLFGIKAIQPKGLNPGLAIGEAVEFSDVLYATNFETFDLGDINLQQGWSGQFVNWVIDLSNPGGSTKHIRSVADGLGQTLAFSPDAGVGTSDVTSTSMLVHVQDTGVTWQIIPQSNSEGFLVTRLSFDPNGSISALVSDNGGEFQEVSPTTPTGYFEVKIEVERSTSNFTIYFDDLEVFSGNGFASAIEQTVFLSLMEASGPIMDIDNFQIVDGIIPELSLSVTPNSGSVSSGESIDVEVTFDATNLLGGIYEEDLVINNNDPANDPYILPTTLTVIDPQIIAISPESLDESLPQEGRSSKTLAISNVGVADLNFRITPINEGGSDEIPWLELNENSGTAASGETIELEVRFDASELEIGNYSGTLLVESDDLRNPEVEIPVNLLVVQPATIGLTPELLELTLYEGFDTDTSFVISNTGDVSLEYEIKSLPSFIPSVSTEIGVIEPSDEETLVISISAESLTPGNYIESVVIESNDPFNPEAEVVIDLTVIEFIVEDMELEAVCSDNPDESRQWKVYNPNDFEWPAFWFIIGSNMFDDILLQPGDNFFTTSTLMDRPNTLKLRWLDEDDQSQQVISESIDSPCEVLNLNLTSVCSNNPELFRRWRVRNPNPFRVMITWEVVGTSQSSSLWAEENSDTFFYTETIPGSANTTIIRWFDENDEEQQKVKASSGEMCDVDNSCNGSEIVAFNQGKRKNGKNVLERRSNTTNALGQPEENNGYNFVSLGFGGSIDIKLANMIVDQPGNDFKVIETSWNDANRPCEAYPETADIFISMDGVNFIFVGSSCKDGEFDISASGLMEMQYIRIVDTSNPALFNGNADGFDVDGVHCINSHFSQAVPVTFGLENTIPDEEEDEVVAFPNPFTESIGVKMKVENEGKFIISVYDNLGVLITERITTSSLGEINAEIDAVNLAEGTYIVTVTSEDGSFRNSNLLIKR